MALVKEREICIDIEQMYLLMFYTIKHLHSSWRCLIFATFYCGNGTFNPSIFTVFSNISLCVLK
ncbi:MAG TPA: hypothetical protein PLC31_04370, partial [Fervidobacterium sp.]|nr:hypothetical protein [Fervidobacterium sp.]